jgi:mRNA interferase MazF
LVVSVPPGDKDRVLFSVVPHTTTLRGSLFEVSIPKPFLKAGAFLIQGLTPIGSHQAIRRLGKLDPHEITKIEAGIKEWLRIA